MSTLTIQGEATRSAHLNIVAMREQLNTSTARGREDFAWWANRKAEQEDHFAYVEESLINGSKAVVSDHQEAARTYRASVH